MPEQRYKVEVQEDHLERLANARPIQAVAELVWNALDADATRVEIDTDSSSFGMRSIAVRDNGDGIRFDEAPDLFRKLGGSWKARSNKSKTRGRFLHGKEGKGRFKALALGRVADWEVFFVQDGNLFQYTITLIRDELVDVRISDLKKQDGGESGVRVNISELYRDFRSLEGEKSVQELSEIFAIYLRTYPEVAISVQGTMLDPASAISSSDIFRLDPIRKDGSLFEIELEIIEWKSATERAIYLCNENGFPLQHLIPQFHTPGFQFSAYLKSSYITQLYEKGYLDLAEMDSELASIYESAKTKIKRFFDARKFETARSHIDHWKEEKVYPFTEDPKTSIDEVERKVFDIVALNINEHLPDFSTGDPKSRAFQFRMLRQVIEKGPEELQRILSEVFELPARKRAELAKLLQETSLSNMISAAKLIADRLKFLNSLEAIIYDADLKDRLKERSQLHKILADNTWVFGEEFNITVDDESLTQVLRKHLESEEREIQIDRPVTKVDGSRGIIDLMFTRSVPSNHADEKEHLIVELKSPKVKVGSKQITQIKEYAFAVANDERFRSLKTRWNFWTLSNDFDSFAEQEVQQKDRPRGLIHQKDDGQVQIKIWLKTWSEVLSECHARLRFIREQLELNVDRDSSLKYLQETYNKYLSGVLEVEDAIEGNDVKSENRS